MFKYTVEQIQLMRKHAEEIYKIEGNQSTPLTPELLENLVQYFHRSVKFYGC